MTFEIRTLERERVIDLVFSGLVTIPERLQAMKAVVTASRTNGFTRLLADFSQANMRVEAHSDVLEYAERLALEPTLHKMAIAYVGTQEQTAGVEGVAALRGYFFQRFFTREAALRWLS
ncbi:MAG: hypothetical protein ACJ8GK_02520 [Luteimonas sp.]